MNSLGWDGAPDVRLSRSAGSGTQWRRAWVKAVDHWHNSPLESFRLSQDEGRGLLIQGTREWANYVVNIDLNAPMAKAAGLAARVQGLRRYYALLLRQDGTAALVKVLDGERELAHVPFDWQGGQTYRLRLSVEGPRVRAFVDDRMLFDFEDAEFAPAERGHCPRVRRRNVIDGCGDGVAAPSNLTYLDIALAKGCRAHNCELCHTR